VNRSPGFSAAAGHYGVPAVRGRDAGLDVTSQFASDLRPFRAILWTGGQAVPDSLSELFVDRAVCFAKPRCLRMWIELVLEHVYKGTQR
jgi:hypothetical protein